VLAESFIDYNYEEINKIADPYRMAQYPDAVSSSDEEDEEGPPAGAAAARSSSEDSSSSSGSGSDPDDDMTVGQLRAGSDAGAPSSEPCVSALARKILCV
jgi:hypothetical protein